jgi:hypothetical protein
MSPKVPPRKKPEPTFEVRFSDPQVDPESIPLRSVSDALSAVQDLASGRDPFVTRHVATEQSIGLLDIRRGSATFRCLSHSPKEAVRNLNRVARLLSNGDAGPANDDRLIALLRPIESLSDISRSVKCPLEVRLPGERQPLFVVRADDFARLSSRLLMEGDTTVAGIVKRVGGVTKVRCLLRVPGRARGLYCDVKDDKKRELVRRLGRHLYEEILAQGRAVWIHRSWRIFKFTITDFTQPRLGKPSAAIKALREAGLDAWDKIDDPEAYLREMRK